MLKRVRLSQLYALFPVWFWPAWLLPVMAYYDSDLREQMRLLKARGCLGWELGFNGAGRPFISKIYWPPGVQDDVEQLFHDFLFGKPEPEPKLGIMTCDSQVDWVLGTGWYALATRHHGAMPPATAGARPGASPHATAIAGQAAPSARAPPLPLLSPIQRPNRPGPRLGGRTCWRKHPRGCRPIAA